MTFHVVVDTFHVYSVGFRSNLIIKKLLSPNLNSASQPEASFSRKVLTFIASSMKALLWCGCDKCDGGKAVSRATWFRHKKKLRSSRERIHSGGKPTVQRNPPDPPGIEPGPSMDIDVSAGQRIPSDDVSVILSTRLSMNANLICLG